MAEESKSLLATGKAKMFFGITLLVGILVGYFAAGVYPPPEDDLTGTIGGVKKAERYRAEQMTEAAVQLDSPEIQKLLQNDKFQKLVENKQFEEIVKNPAFQAELLKSADFQAALLKSADFQAELLKSADFQAEFMKSADFQAELLKSADFQALNKGVRSRFSSF